MSEISEFAVKVLMEYANEQNELVRGTTDTSKLEQWLIMKLFKTDKSLSSCAEVSLAASPSGAKSKLTFGEWIDIKNQEPEYDGEYLVKIYRISMTPHTEIKILFGRKYTLVRGDNVYHNFGWHGLHSELRVTHWMPLPKL